MQKALRDGSLIEVNTKLPVLPLKEVVIFPYMIYPLLVGRTSSLRAVEEAMLQDKHIFLLVQKNMKQEEPGTKDLYRIGVVARVLQVLKLPNGLMKVLVEGVIRGRISRFIPKADYLQAQIEVTTEDEEVTAATKAKVRKVSDLFKDYVRLNRNLPDEVMLTADKIEQPQRFADLVSAHLHRDVKAKQKLLESKTVEKQLFDLMKILESETEILELERELDDKVKNRIYRSQRNIYLQEQMRAIQEELGDDGEIDGEYAYLSESIKKAKMPEEAEERALEELDKLRSTPPFSPESTVIRNYLDWLLAVPWYKKTRDNLKVDDASQILDEDHFGLKKPKAGI